MYINFQQNWDKTQVVTLLTSLFAKNRTLHKFATTNNNFKQECDLVTVLVCINLLYY